MQQTALADRTALAAKLRDLKQGVAEKVTDEFFRRHPDWLVRYGERGRRLGIEDACFHLDFLAGAIESGTFAPFEDYARWTTRMLAARKIAPHFVVENLLQIQQALATRLTGPECELTAAYLSAGCVACETATEEQPDHGEQTDLALTRSLFLQAILKGQRKAAGTAVSEAIREGKPPLEVYVEVLQESLYQVGRLWETNRITVAEEHAATAITQYVMAQMYAQLPPARCSRGKMVITGVAGELHQVGANMVADVLDAEGYDVRFLGTNMPHDGILNEVEEHQADVLGISATMLFNVPQVVQLVTSLRERFGQRCPRIFLGGAAFRAAPSLGADLGVAGVATDLRAAVNLLC